VLAEVRMLAVVMGDAVPLVRACSACMGHGKAVVRV